MFNVYISHSVSPVELAQVYALAEDATRQGLRPTIPHRQWSPNGPLPADLQSSLKKSQAMLLFVTTLGQYDDWVNTEVREMGNKHLVALIEEGVQLSGVPPENTVRFSRFGNFANAVDVATNRLRHLGLKKQNENLLAGLLIGGLVLLLARGLEGKGGGD